MNQQKKDEITHILNSGGLVVMPADTIYGIFASARSKPAIEKLYRLRGRDTNKPCIILCADISQIRSYIKPLSSTKKSEVISFLHSKECKNMPTTFILKCKKNLTHLDRGTGTLAFRIPSKKTKRSRGLLSILKKTGPLLAPSANLAGEKPAQTIRQAKKYFAQEVELYVAHGKKLESNPSQIYDLTKSKIKKLR